MTESIQLSVLLYNLGKWSGFAGLTCLTLLITSGDTARYFDRFFGLDKIIKFQRKFSLFTALFVIAHPLFFILSSKSVQIYLIPNFSIISLALGIMAFYIFIIIMVSSSIYKRISYTAWQYLHILTYILIFFGLYHANYWGSDRNLWYVKTLYILALIMIITGIIYRTQYKIRKKFGPKFFVKEIKKETPDTFTLILKSNKEFYFKAGQFCFLRLNKNKLYSRHPFTISSEPENENIHFTIKMHGRFTEAAANLQPGEEILIDGPFGIFTIKTPDKNLAFIAGGVGITPFMSIIKNHLNKDITQNITLFYGTKTEEDIIFKRELDDIKESWFKKIYVLSRAETVPENMEKGFINEELLKKYIDNFQEYLFYICGPEKMKNSIQKILKKFGIPKKQIIIEDFFW